MRVFSALAALAAALSLAGTAGAATRALTVDRGIVQSVSATRIVLRELDGSTVSIGIGTDTRVLVNGFAATTEDVQPGFVAAVTHRGASPALLIRAVGRIVPVVDRGVVVTSSARSVAIHTLDGRNVTVRVTPRTKIRWRGLPVTIAAVQPGRLVEIAHTRAGIALRIAVRGRRPL